MRKAVVDVGSNSLILVVEEFDGSTWHRLKELTAVTSIGEGTKSTGLLGERGMRDSLAALTEMFSLAREMGAESIVAAGTMAVRIATNQAEFLSRAADQGTPVFVLSGDDEAQLGFQAIATDPKFSSLPRLSVIDPGGQSTEIVTAVQANGKWTVLFRRSFPFGTLALRGGILSSPSPEVPAILEASAYLDDVIGMCYLPNASGPAILLGATGTNLVSIRERLTGWDPERVHGEYLTYEEISRTVGSMMPLTDAERANIVGMEPGREKTIHIGALIAERCLSAMGCGGCFVSVRGWRHALLEQGLPGSTQTA